MEKRIACTARKVFSTIPHLNGDILAKTLLKYTRKVPNGHSTIQYKIPFLVKKKRSIFFLQFFPWPETPEDKMRRNLKSYFSISQTNSYDGSTVFIFGELSKRRILLVDSDGSLASKEPYPGIKIR